MTSIIAWLLWPRNNQETITKRPPPIVALATKDLKRLISEQPSPNAVNESLNQSTRRIMSADSILAVTHAFEHELQLLEKKRTHFLKAFLDANNNYIAVFKIDIPSQEESSLIKSLITASQTRVTNLKPSMNLKKYASELDDITKDYTPLEDNIFLQLHVPSDPASPLLSFRGEVSLKQPASDLTQPLDPSLFKNLTFVKANVTSSQWRYGLILPFTN